MANFKMKGSQKVSLSSLMTLVSRLSQTMIYLLSLSNLKGQLFSKGLFDVIVWSQKNNEISASKKKRLDQKIKALYITKEGLFNIVMYVLNM